MVFKTLALLGKNRGPDEFWRKRKVFRLAAHFWGRSRNCYSITLRRFMRSMQNSVRGRELKKKDVKELWDTRISAACEQHSFNSEMLRAGLTRCDIFLNRKVLCDLAIWEPRTFKALTDLAWTKVKEDGIQKAADLTDPPPGVITRGMLKS